MCRNMNRRGLAKNHSGWTSSVRERYPFGRCTKRQLQPRQDDPKRHQQSLWPRGTTTHGDDSIPYLTDSFGVVPYIAYHLFAVFADTSL